MKKILPIALSLSVLGGCGDGCNSDGGLESGESFIDRVTPDFLEDPKVDISIGDVKSKLDNVVGFNPLLGEENIAKLIFKIPNSESCNLRSLFFYSTDERFYLNTRSITFNGKILVKSDEGFVWNGSMPLRGIEKVDFSILTYNSAPDTSAIDVSIYSPYRLRIKPKFSNCKVGQNKVNFALFGASVYTEKYWFHNHDSFKEGVDLLHEFHVKFQKNDNKQNNGDPAALDGNYLKVNYRFKNPSDKHVSIGIPHAGNENLEVYRLEPDESMIYIYNLKEDAKDVVEKQQTLSFYVYIVDHKLEDDVNLQIEPIDLSFVPSGSNVIHKIDFR